MSTTIPAWRFECYALVPHPSEQRVLVRIENDTYTLPRIEVIAASADDAFAQMLTMFARELSCSLTVLRSIARQVDEAARQVVEILVMEHHGTTRTLLANARWLSRDDLACRPLARPELRALIEHELREVENGIAPPLRPPWARRGWHAQAVTWIEARLAHLGTPLEGPDSAGADVESLLRPSRANPRG